MTVERVEYNVGDEVTLLAGFGDYDISGYQRPHADNVGQSFPVDFVYARGTSVRIRMPDRYGNMRNYRVPLRNLEPTDPSKPRPRKLGEVPTEGEHITVDDPRIQWIFEDMGKLATQVGHCSEYDQMADRIGFPGRERNFKVTRKVNGLSATFHVKARSKPQAEAIVAEKFGEANAVTEEEF